MGAHISRDTINEEPIKLLCNAVVLQAAVDYLTSKRWLAANGINIKELIHNDKYLDLCKKYVYYDNMYNDSLNFFKGEYIYMFSDINPDYLIMKLDNMTNNFDIREVDIFS